MRYDVYVPSGKERAEFYIAACLSLALLGFLFYRSLMMAGIFACFAKFLEKIWLERKAGKRRARLSEGFRDALYGISASVAAGRQMPAALSDAARLAEDAYGADSDICVELSRIVEVYRSFHADPSAMLSDFGRRSGIPEIAQFASSYGICRAAGGDLESVCLKSAGLLLDRLAFRSEADSIMAQKKLDAALLISLPVIVLALLNLISYSYLSVLYSSAAGRVIMTLCLAAMGGAAFWSLRITDMEL